MIVLAPLRAVYEGRTCLHGRAPNPQAPASCFGLRTVRLICDKITAVYQILPAGPTVSAHFKAFQDAPVPPRGTNASAPLYSSGSSEFLISSCVLAGANRGTVYAHPSRWGYRAH